MGRGRGTSGAREETEQGDGRGSHVSPNALSYSAFFPPRRQDYTFMTCELAALTHRSLSTRRGE